MLKKCLKSIIIQEYPAYEIIIVDDGSNDGTDNMVLNEFPSVRYIHQKNAGPAAARNKGIESAKGDIIAFTDDDCIVPENWLDTLRKGFDRYPGVVGVGGYQDPPESYIISNPYAAAEKTRRLNRWGDRATIEQYGGYDIPGLMTNNVAYRKDVLLEVGGFDSNFPIAAGEDADLKLRIAAEGYPLLYIPMGVEHYRSYTFKSQCRMAIRRGLGAYLFEKKHFKPPSAARIGLRLVKRTLYIFINLLNESWKISIFIYLDQLGDVFGQLIAWWKEKGKVI